MKVSDDKISEPLGMVGFAGNVSCFLFRVFTQSMWRCGTAYETASLSPTSMKTITFQLPENISRKVVARHPAAWSLYPCKG